MRQVIDDLVRLTYHADSWMTSWHLFRCLARRLGESCGASTPRTYSDLPGARLRRAASRVASMADLLGCNRAANVVWGAPGSTPGVVQGCWEQVHLGYRWVQGAVAGL